jgi:hypothetical protein
MTEMLMGIKISFTESRHFDGAPAPVLVLTPFLFFYKVQKIIRFDACLALVSDPPTLVKQFLRNLIENNL